MEETPRRNVAPDPTRWAEGPWELACCVPPRDVHPSRRRPGPRPRGALPQPGSGPEEAAGRQRSTRVPLSEPPAPLAL